MNPPSPMAVHMVCACPLIHSNMILPTQVQTFYKEHEFLFIFTIQNLVQSTLVVTTTKNSFKMEPNGSLLYKFIWKYKLFIRMGLWFIYIQLQSKKSSGIAIATISLLAISRLCGRVVHWQFPLLHDNLYKADCSVPVQTSKQNH